MTVPSDKEIKKIVEAIENQEKSLLAEKKALKVKMRECHNAHKEAERVVKKFQEARRHK